MSPAEHAILQPSRVLGDPEFGQKKKDAPFLKDNGLALFWQTEANLTWRSVGTFDGRRCWQMQTRNFRFFTTAYRSVRYRKRGVMSPLWWRRSNVFIVKELMLGGDERRPASAPQAPPLSRRDHRPCGVALFSVSPYPRSLSPECRRPQHYSTNAINQGSIYEKCSGTASTKYRNRSTDNPNRS